MLPFSYNGMIKDVVKLCGSLNIHPHLNFSKFSVGKIEAVIVKSKAMWKERWRGVDFAHG